MSSILVVDEEAVIRDVFKELLQREGHCVATARSGRDGLKLMESVTFDLVVTGYVMSPMNGAEFLTAIRQQGLLMPVILCISPDSEIMARCMMMGFAVIIKRPFDNHEVLRHVQEHLHLHAPIYGTASMPALN